MTLNFCVNVFAHSTVSQQFHQFDVISVKILGLLPKIKINLFVCLKFERELIELFLANRKCSKLLKTYRNAP